MQNQTHLKCSCFAACRFDELRLGFEAPGYAPFVCETNGVAALHSL